MRTRILVSLVALFVGLVLALPALRAEERLSGWKFREGASRSYRQTADMEVTVPAVNDQPRTVQRMRMEVFTTATVARVDFLGNAEIKTTIHGLRMSVKQQVGEQGDMVIVLDTLDPANSKATTPAPKKTPEDRAAGEGAEEGEPNEESAAQPDEKAAPPPGGPTPDQSVKEMAGLLAEALNGYTTTAYVTSKGAVLYTGASLDSFTGALKGKRDPQAVVRALALRGLISSMSNGGSAGTDQSLNVAYVAPLPLWRSPREGGTWQVTSGSFLQGATARTKYTLNSVTRDEESGAAMYDLGFTTRVAVAGVMSNMYDIRALGANGKITAGEDGLIRSYASDMDLEVRYEADSLRETVLPFAVASRVAKGMRGGTLDPSKLADLIEEENDKLAEQMKLLSEMVIKEKIHTTIAEAPPPAPAAPPAPPAAKPGTEEGLLPGLGARLRDIFQLPGAGGETLEAEGPRHSLALTDANFEDYATGDLTLFVDFWAPWCGPCKKLSPDYEALAGEFDGRAVFGRMNIDDHKKTPAKFNVKGIPCIVALRGGKEVARHVGYHGGENRAILKTFIEKALTTGN
ncbi:MAG: hypothetical protein HY719_12085 [Planctomycetes bacterium]|nr:hypothetical protein [Planctomycetota bacterium]